jgi:deoxyribose-phosphate aldolase
MKGDLILMKRNEVASIIDHTLLRADAAISDIERLCDEAERYGFYSVCVNPHYVKRVKGRLKGTQIKVATVVGFPLGMDLTDVKVFEAMMCALAGADELDIVINIGAARDGLWDVVRADLADVVAATGGLVHKAIIETCYLTEDEKKAAVEAVLGAGAEFVKTSTGYGTGGATVEDVRLIKSVVGDRAGIKAAGGIKTFGQVKEMADAGATRIGTSSGVAIVEKG